VGFWPNYEISYEDPPNPKISSSAQSNKKNKGKTLMVA